MNIYNEDMIEKYTIDMFEKLGYQHVLGSNLNPNEVIMWDVLAKQVYEISKDIKYNRGELTMDIVNISLQRIFNFESTDTIGCNKEFLKILKDGKNISIKNENFYIKLIDEVKVDNNIFMIVDQYTIKGKLGNRRPDLIVYVNGIPISIIELKNGFNLDIGLEDAYNQVVTYRNELPNLFETIQFNLISNGVSTKVGTLTSNYNRYSFYRDKVTGELDICFVIPEIYSKDKLIDIIFNYTEFSYDNKKHKYNKIMLQYHQIRAIDNFKNTYDGGYIWHTQGSGKSYTMAFMALDILKNKHKSRIVVVTDRNDLDKQLYNTFLSFNSTKLVNSKRINNRIELKEVLSQEHGQYATFTTLQKLEESHGVINDSERIYIFTDEAHRSQYALAKKFDCDTGNFSKGYATMLREAFPNAKFIGFTGTPIENEDKSTTGVFGKEIDKYDITQSVMDKSTVPISVHQKLQRLNTDVLEVKKIEAEIDEMSKTDVSQEAINKEIKKLTSIQAVIGDKTRIKELVEVMLKDFDNNYEQTKLKAMFVATNREIAVKVYDEINRVRSYMCNEDLTKGQVKVIMTTNASDTETMNMHKYEKIQQDQIAERFKDETSDLKLIIVVDMWLTGFDVPCVNTMYLDKLMRKHTLMQAITRVNRVYPNKVEGRIIDFIGNGENIKEALQIYATDKEDNAFINTKNREEYLNDVTTLIEECQMLTPKLKWRELLNSSYNKIDLVSQLRNEMDQNKELKDKVTSLKKLKNLVITDIEEEQRNEIAFLEAVLALSNQNSKIVDTDSIEDMIKRIKDEMGSYFSDVETLETYDLLQIASHSVDIFSEEFLEAIRKSTNDASNVKLMEKLIRHKCKEISKENIIKAEKFSKLLRETIAKLEINGINSRVVLEDLIDLSLELVMYTSQTELTHHSKFYVAVHDMINKQKKHFKEGIDDNLITEVCNNIDDIIISFIEKNSNWQDSPNLEATIRMSSKKELIKILDPKCFNSVTTDIVTQLKNMEQ